MPRAQRYSRRRFVDITPAVNRQLERLAAYHERSVPELIRQAIAQAYGLPTAEDRQPRLTEAPATPKSGRGAKTGASARDFSREDAL